MPEIPQQVGLTPEQIAQFQADPNEWMRAVLGGQYLGANPYIDQLISQIEADAQRQFQESILPTETARLNMSGAYGTALGQQARAGAAEDFARGLMGQTAGIRFQDYGSERDRMMQALGLLSGETAASRQGLFGARDTDVQSATNLQQTQMQTAAQRAAARMAAGASRYAADRSYAGQRLGAQASYWNNLFNRSQQMRGLFGGPAGSIGQRGAGGGGMATLPFIPPTATTPFVPSSGALRSQGVYGGPAGGPVRYDGPGAWDNPGAF